MDVLSIIIQILVPFGTLVIGTFIGLKKQINVPRNERLIQLYTELFNKISAARGQALTGRIGGEFVFFRDFFAQARQDDNIYQLTKI